MKKLEKYLLKELMANRNKLWAMAYSITRDFHMTEDILQETSIAVIQNAEKFHNDKPFLPWAIGITRNQALKAINKAGKHPYVMSNDIIEKIENQLAAETNESTDIRFPALKKCLLELSEENRRIMKMKYIDKLSAEKIAEHVKRTETATFSLLQRLRVSLAKCIKNKMSNEILP